jgi:GNAT superfamily N-acetyltransferase
VDADRVLAAIDTQVRRGTTADGSGARIEADQRVVRWVGSDSGGWSGITWSHLSEADADRVIAEQVAFFRDRGEAFTWKLYDYDQPPDLAQRLEAAGLVAEDTEALMVADVTEVPALVTPPAGVRLVPVTGEASVRWLIDVHEEVFGTDHSRLRQSLLAQLRDAPELTAMVVAMAGDQPVCSARIAFMPGTDFASLWGGGTLPAWRGKGIYRAMVAYRAQQAAGRGCRYLQVEASRESQPILARIGFTTLARTTPFQWDPGPRPAA